MFQFPSNTQKDVQTLAPFSYRAVLSSGYELKTTEILVSK